MVLWRYLSFGYLKVFSLSVATFVWMLLVLRFKEIARFAALNGSWLKTGLFTVYQIPFILPMAIPLSALIAALLLFQRMSHEHEVTALRASGVGLGKVLIPVLMTAAFLSLGNWFMCAEIAPFCRRASKTLFYQETSENPLLLLQRQQLVKLKRTYLQFDVVKEGKRAKNVVLIAPNQDRLALVNAKTLTVRGEHLLGQDLALVSYLPNSLLIENQAHMSMAAPLLSNTLKKSRPRLDVASHGWSTVRSWPEKFRRMCLALAVFSFTVSGAVFGLEERRVRSRKNLLIALCLNLFVFVCYFLGKSCKHHPFVAGFVYLAPHPLLWAVCWMKTRRLA